MRPITLCLVLALAAWAAPCAEAQSSWLRGGSEAEEAAPPALPARPVPRRRPSRFPGFVPPELPADLVGRPLDLLGSPPGVAPGRLARDAFKRAREALASGQASEALNEAALAYGHGYPRHLVEPLLVRALLVAERADHAAFHAVHALRDRRSDRLALLLDLGRAHGLRGDVAHELAAYRKALELDPDSGEAHFLLALAYDKVDDSPKVLEHAQKAIRIDPEYKARLKPRIRDSNVQRKIARIVTNVLRDARRERLTDEQIEAYADEIGDLLGEDPGGRARRPASALR